MNVTSITKAKKILQHQLDILWDNPEKAEMVPPLMIWGPPGIGSLPSFETCARKTKSDLSMLD